MPNIPFERLPSVAPGQPPGAMLSPNAPEGAFGYGPQADAAYGEARGLSSDAARMLMEEHAKQAREADEANVNDAIVKLAALKNKLVFDPNGGLLSKKGDAAAAAYQPTMDAWKQGAAAINDSLITKEQKALFQRHLVGEHVSLDGTMARYIGGEIENKKLGSAAAAADTMANDAIAMATVDPLQVGGKLAGQRGKLEQLADLKGVTDPVARESFISEGLSKTNLGVVKAMITAGQDLNASRYFEANKDAFRGGDLISGQELVRDGSYRGEAQRELAKIISPGVTDSEGGLRIYNDKPPTEREMYERVKKIEDPKLQDMVRNRLDEYVATQKRIDHDEYVKTVSDAEDIVQRTGSVNNIPVDMMEKLRGTEVRGLYALAKQLNTAEPIKTKWNVYTNLKDMAANQDTRKDFLKMLPMAWREDLGDTEFKEMVNIREGLIKGDEKTKQKMDGYRSVSGIINTHLDNNGFDLNRNALPGSDLAKQRETIEQLMDEEIKYYRVTHKGEEPSNEDVKKMVSQMTQDVVLNPDAWFGGKGKGYEATQKYLETADTAIPPDERKKIEAAMQRQGIVPTRRGIVEAWRAKNAPETKFLPK